jgi:hypothetical protein
VDRERFGRVVAADEQHREQQQQRIGNAASHVGSATTET